MTLLRKALRERFSFIDLVIYGSVGQLANHLTQGVQDTTPRSIAWFIIFMVAGYFGLFIATFLGHVANEQR